MNISALNTAFSAMNSIIKKIDLIANNIAKSGMEQLSDIVVDNSSSPSINPIQQLHGQGIVTDTISPEIDIISELIQLIVARRSFEVNAKVVKMSDKLLQETIKVI